MNYFTKSDEQASSNTGWAIVAVLVLLSGLQLLAAIPAATLELLAPPQEIIATARLEAETVRLFPSLRGSHTVEVSRVKPARATGLVQFSYASIEDCFLCFFYAPPPNPSRVVVPAGTRVWACGAWTQTEDARRCASRGVGFQTLKPATLHGKNKECFLFGCSVVSERVPIRALEPTGAANVAAGEVAFCDAGKVLDRAIGCSNVTPTRGGYDGTERVVRDQDITRARSALESKLRAQALPMLRERAERGYTLTSPTFVLEQVESDHVAGSLSLSVTVTATLNGSAASYRPNRLRPAAIAALRAVVPPHRRLIVSTVRWDLPVASVGGAEMIARGTAGPALDEIRTMARGRSPEAAAAAIKESMGVDVRIKRGSLPIIPRLHQRIRVVVVPTPPVH